MVHIVTIAEPIWPILQKVSKTLVIDVQLNDCILTFHVFTCTCMSLETTSIQVPNQMRYKVYKVLIDKDIKHF